MGGRAVTSFGWKFVVFYLFLGSAALEFFRVIFKRYLEGLGGKLPAFTLPSWLRTAVTSSGGLLGLGPGAWVTASDHDLSPLLHDLAPRAEKLCVNHFPFL